MVLFSVLASSVEPVPKLPFLKENGVQRSSLSDVFGWYDITPTGVLPAENMGAVKERSD